ncbi:DUF418 domain-containing protein [Maribacter sp. HTCC2170]|uniref:DUF418 domain-containing protein n=1 Tax=Maribacter sp. (strain HTCC2170 / KCCM 42371) TaxID=313603 RepID=UPI00006BD343|nr:DUF418 domain-containing protein [Maribacter sp. HTCC2170]EAR02430.1 hypothetical protein FB2170_04065 [Maribacter sp. HTCC2170]
MSIETNLKKPRIEVVDSLRGFAIMAIMLIHSIEHFNFYVFPDPSTQPAWLNSIDKGIWDTLFLLVGGKGYAIFALLFGFTFSLMYAKQQAKEVDFGPRFLWRMLLLVCFALFNGLFFPGEVLMMYALVGVVLFLVRKFNNTWLLVAALLLLLQPIEWARYIYYLFNNDYLVQPSGQGPYWNLLKEAQLGDSFINQVKANTLYGHKVSLMWAYGVGRLVQTAGLFVIGYWLGKKKLFVDSEKSNKFWKRTLIIGATVFIPLFLLEKNFAELTDVKIHAQTLLKVVDMYGNLALTAVLVASFILLYKTNIFRKIAGGLRYCGRMSLTAYVLQSIIGGFVFFGYGMGLGPKLLHTKSLAIGIVLFAGLFYFCKWWINTYGQGPLEKLWHRLTWIDFSGKNKE